MKNQPANREKFLRFRQSQSGVNNYEGCRSEFAMMLQKWFTGLRLLKEVYTTFIDRCNRLNELIFNFLSALVYRFTPLFKRVIHKNNLCMTVRYWTLITGKMLPAN
jgi:hypothetical protein